MNDLICKNTMARCQTPGMCSPYGGCRETEPVSSVWLEQLRSEFRPAVLERDRLQVENEALRKDAERWRFIRDEWPKVKLVPNGDWFNSCFLEREVDAAMSKKG